MLSKAIISIISGLSFQYFKDTHILGWGGEGSGAFFWGSCVVGEFSMPSLPLDETLNWH